MSSFESQFTTFAAPELGRKFGEAATFVTAAGVSTALTDAIIGDEVISEAQRDDGRWEIRTRLVTLRDATLAAAVAATGKLTIGSETWDVMRTAGNQDGMTDIVITRQRLIQFHSPGHERGYP